MTMFLIFPLASVKYTIFSGVFPIVLSLLLTTLSRADEFTFSTIAICFTQSPLSYIIYTYMNKILNNLPFSNFFRKKISPASKQDLFCKLC